MRKLKCWQCGFKQPMPPLKEIVCEECKAKNMYVPSNMRGGVMER